MKKLVLSLVLALSLCVSPVSYASPPQSCGNFLANIGFAASLAFFCIAAFSAGEKWRVYKEDLRANKVYGTVLALPLVVVDGAAARVVADGLSDALTDRPDYTDEWVIGGAGVFGAAITAWASERAKKRVAAGE